MLLAAAGGVDHSQLVELAKKYFGNIEHGAKDILDYEPGKFTASYVSLFIFDFWFNFNV
jgi:predicted Zn-dependent peptidase